MRLLNHCSGEEKLNRAIDEIRAMEDEKLQNAVAGEKQRAEELETNVEQLRQVGVLLRQVGSDVDIGGCDVEIGGCDVE